MAAEERIRPAPSLRLVVALLLVVDLLCVLNHSRFGPIRGLGGFLFPDPAPWYALGLLNTVVLVAVLRAQSERLGRLAAHVEASVGKLARLPKRLARFGERSGHLLAWALLGLALALFCLPWLGVRTVRPLPMSAVTPQGGHSYRVTVPRAGPSEFEPLHGGSALVLLESGQPLSLPRMTPADIEALGAGRYRHWQRRLIFSSSDNTDPRTNGRDYAIDVPWQPTPWLLALVLLPAVCLNAGRLRQLFLWGAAHPGASALTIALICLACRLKEALERWDGDLGGMMVRGAPVSDADNWNTMALYLSQGEPVSAAVGGWDARRPLYYLVLGAVYSITGEELWAARLLNIAFDVAAAVFILDGVRRLAPYPVAVLSALVFATNTFASRIALSTLSEPLGHVMTAASVWALAVGLSGLQQGSTSTRRWAAGSGALLALSNLARPINLLAAPLLAVLSVVLARQRGPGGLKRGLRFAGLFLVGLGLTLSPWLIRQRVRYGLLSLSDNTSETLLAAASPEYGTWTAEVADLAGPVSLPERIQFYREHAREALTENTAFYLRNAATHAKDAVLKLVPEKGWLLGLSLLFPALVLGDPRRPSRRAVFVGGVGAAVALGLVPYLRIMLWLVAGLWLLARPRPLGALPLLLFGTVAALGVLATPPPTRLTYSQTWLLAGSSGWLWFRLLGHWGGELAPGLEQAPDWSPRATRCVKRLVGVLAAAFLTCAASLAAHQWTPPAPAPPPLEPAEQARLLDLALASEAGRHYAELEGLLSVQTGTVRKDYVFWSDGQTSLHPWQALFQARPYGYTHLRALPPLSSGTGGVHGAIFPARLPPSWRDSPLAFLGVGVTEGTYSTALHVIAVARRREETQDWELITALPEIARLHARDIRASLSAAQRTQ